MLTNAMHHDCHTAHSPCKAAVLTAVVCTYRLASKTDMLERLYDCLTALQQQYEINREDGLYWQQTAQTTATQLAMTGEASLTYLVRHFLFCD